MAGRLSVRPSVTVSLVAASSAARVLAAAETADTTARLGPSRPRATRRPATRCHASLLALVSLENTYVWQCSSSCHDLLCGRDRGLPVGMADDWDALSRPYHHCDYLTPR